MSSPAPFSSEMDSNRAANNPFVDIPARPMRVKILYTFDDDNKTNCLARFPDILRIPTVPIDDTTQIGVIELRTCIRAIVAASPELVSRLCQGDFTIYAFDYSEYETPLVGQGMLSSILAAASPTPTAPAHQSKTMITGRVCKNILGLFTNGVQETLEVKLRLVPVPRPVQNEYIKSMEMYRTHSPAMSGGFDPNVWSETLSLEAPFEQQPNFMIQDVAASIYNPGNQHHRHMSNASTSARPMTGQGNRGGSRPSSRASIRSEHAGRKPDESFANQGMELFQDDGPARKRVKVTQTDWRGKSSFGGNTDDLRVTASTAASIRVHKPVPTRPGMPTSNSLEPPPRVPTPVPNGVGSGRFRPNPAGFARRESSLFNAQTPNSPYDPPSQSMYAQSDVVMSSPEDFTVDQTMDMTPFDFPSSPPVMPEPSSPGLPTLPRPADSGYMSGGTLECLQDEEDRPVDDEDMQLAARYKQRPSTLRSDISFIEQTPGPPELLPTRMLNSQSAPKGQEQKGMSQAEVSHMKAQNSTSHRRSSLALPPRPGMPPSLSTNSSDSAMLQQNQVQQSTEFPQNSAFPKPPMRANSVVGAMRSSEVSPAPSEDLMGKPLPRSGSGAKRKKVIQDKLMASIASGVTPMFCANCGAIETPTWRSLHIKTVNGCPVEENADQDGVTGIEVMTRDKDSDKVTSYRIIKSMRKSRDRVEMQGYETVSVCNPCGLWFNKFKYMRPSEKWNKGSRTSKRSKTKKESLQSDMAEPQSDFPQSDYPQSGLWTDAAQPEEPTEEPEKTSEEPRTSLPAPVNRPRASSVQVEQRLTGAQDQWNEADLNAALHRAIQSSPGRISGTQESPIELEDDLTPKPTRRLLFPSPRKLGEAKSLDDSCLPSSKDMQTDSTTIVSSYQINMASVEVDKENQPPVDFDEDFSHLFEGSPSAFFKTPSKNTPKKTPKISSAAKFDDLLATPTPARRTISGSLSRTPNRDPFLPTFSSAETKALYPVTPSRYNSLTSPSSNRAESLTPFTRHLTQLLNETASASHSGSTEGLGFNLNLSGSFSSPSRALDFGDMPTFMTPGRDYSFASMDFSGFDALDGRQGSGSGEGEKCGLSQTSGTETETKSS